MLSFRHQSLWRTVLCPVLDSSLELIQTKTLNLLWSVTLDYYYYFYSNYY